MHSYLNAKTALRMPQMVTLNILPGPFKPAAPDDDDDKPFLVLATILMPPLSAAAAAIDGTGVWAEGKVGFVVIKKPFSSKCLIAVAAAIA